MLRRIAGCAGVFVVLLGLGVGLALYNITGSEPGPPAPPPTPVEREEARQAVDRIRKEVRKAEPGQTVVITEAEANKILRADPDVSREVERQRIGAPQVRFVPGRLIATARVPLAGSLKARLSATGRVDVRNGKLEYRTEDVRLGDLPAPSHLRGRLDREVETALREVNHRLAGRIQDVRIDTGALSILLSE